ncbi:MAG: PAS domain-containing protein, partial [Bradyrhizobiaceae bacterium]
MTSSDFQLRGVGDPRLAVHATSPWPAWLWSIDGARVLWANPVGARLFGAAHGAALAEKTFGPADPHRRQVARLARQLPADGAVRLERLRGFGARLGTLMTCACSRLDFADGGHAVLVTAMDPGLRAMPLIERLHRLVEGAKMPMAAFAPDGLFVGASEAARALLGFRDLSEAGLEQARSDALRDGRAETGIGIGQMVLQRVGRGADVGLVALIEPAAAAQAKPAEDKPGEARPAEVQPAETIPAAPVPERAADVASEAIESAQAAEAMPSEPSLSQDGSTAISLFDAFAEPIEAPTTAHTATETIAPETQQAATFEDATEVPVQEPTREAPGEAADTAAKTPVENLHEAIVPPQAAPMTSPMVEPPSGPAEPPAPRQHPLRFLWQSDAEGRFVLLSEEFIGLIGAHTASRFGRPWHE